MNKVRKVVTRDAFQHYVELWLYKGHSNVVSVEFNGATMNLIVPDYIDPKVEHMLNVIDTMTRY